MKKRSLVAALAMLVVSAIVLTSSTYAWFAASSTADVESINATITNANGALTLKALYNGSANAVEKVKLQGSDFPTVGTTLTPVSMYVNSQGIASAYYLKYEGSTFLPGGIAKDVSTGENCYYQHYSYEVKYMNGTSAVDTVKMKTEFTSTTEYCYGLVIVSDDNGSTQATRYLFTNGTYAPVTNLTDNVEDTNQETNCSFVIDSRDTNVNNAIMPTDMMNNVTPSSNGTVDLMQVKAGETGTRTVDVYVWAEGQDAQCVTGAESGNAYFEFDFYLASTAAQN